MAPATHAASSFTAFVPGSRRQGMPPWLAALRLENEAGSAEIDAIEISEHHRPGIVAGDGADIEVDPLGG